MTFFSNQNKSEKKKSKSKPKMAERLNSSVIRKTGQRKSSEINQGELNKSQIRRKSEVKPEKKNLNKSMNDGKKLNSSMVGKDRGTNALTPKKGKKPIKLSKGNNLLELGNLMKVADLKPDAKVEETKESTVIVKISLAEKIESLTINRLIKDPTEFVINQLVERDFVQLPEALTLSLMSKTNKEGLLEKTKELKRKPLETKLARLNEKLSKFTVDSALESMLSKQFVASKTAQNGLNFINKEEEKKLCESKQTEEIENIFRFVLILLEENDVDQTENPIERLFSQVYERYDVNSISRFLKRKFVHFDRYTKN